MDSVTNVAFRTSTFIGHQKIASRESPSSLPRARLDFAVSGLYLALAIFLTGRLWIDLEHRRTVISSDHSQFIWYLRHAVRIVTEGVNPFATTMFNAPEGVNLMANTSALGLALPMVPFTMLFGPSFSFALLIVLGLAGTAYGWYFVFSRHLVRSRLAAAIAGGFCGFAPGMVSHANGHINWTAQFLVPFIVLAALRLRRARDGILLGLLVAYQAFINEEVLLYTALALAVFMASYALVARVRQPILPGLLVALLISLPVLAYPLYWQFFGPYGYDGLPSGVAHYRADLASYPAFSRLSIGGLSTSDRLAWNISEQNAFFGWPLLLASFAIVIWLWQRAFVRALAITAGVFFILSLGSTLLVARQNTSIPLPWMLLGKLPVFDHVLTTRLALVLVPLIASLLALAIEMIRGITDARWRRLAFLAVAVALVPVLPLPIPARDKPSVPAFITSGEWRNWIRPGTSLATIPVTSEQFPSAMEWQRSSSDFTLVGGYFLGPDPTGRARFGAQPRPTATLFREVAKTGRLPVVTPAMREQFREDVAYWNASALVLPDTTANSVPLRQLMNSLQGPGRRITDVTIWPTHP